jgi:hypothetical protein
VKAPVTVTLNLPGLLETHESVEVPVAPRTTLTGFNEHVSPLARVAKLDRFTVPVRLFSDVTVMVESPLPPRLEMVTDVGLAPIVKSPETVTPIAAVVFVMALLLPPAAVIITL